MAKESTKEPTDAERLRAVMKYNAADIVIHYHGPRYGYEKEKDEKIDIIAAEFAAPYLARITELEAENARLQSVFVPPSSSLILIAPEAASQDEMHDTAKRAAAVHDGPVIVMAHDWQSMSVDELRAHIKDVAL